MSSPHTSKKMRLEINGIVVDVVELVNLEILHTGNVESKYGQDWTGMQYKPRNRHKVGMKKARFTIRRWFKAGAADTDLLYDLHDTDTVFILKEYLNDLYSQFAGLEIDDCVAYRYTADTGSANDIIVEEIQGEGLTYEEVIPTTTTTITPPPCYPTEIIVNGGFETGDLTGWTVSGHVTQVFGAPPYGGTYAVETNAQVYPSYFMQVIADIPVNSVISASLWAREEIDGLNHTDLNIEVGYTDSTTTTYTKTEADGLDMTYKQWDFLSSLSVGKTINYIKIYNTKYEGMLYVDNISVMACI